MKKRREKKMETEQKFYYCEACKNLVIMLYDSGIPLNCCGADMEELVPSSSDGAVEKHIPVYEQNGNTVRVKVASVEHPMTAEHYIEWVALKTDKGISVKHLTPNDKPEACFALCEGERVMAVYEYCNLHGLWHLLCAEEK
jgi:superoxide reductase